MIQVDFIQMDDSCAISLTAFLFMCSLSKFKDVSKNKFLQFTLEFLVIFDNTKKNYCQAKIFLLP